VNRVPARLAVLLLHQEADASGDERLRVKPATLRKWVQRGHLTRGPSGYDLREILDYLQRRENTMQPGSYIECPVDGCDWTLRVDEEPQDVTESLHERVLANEIVLRQHFENHDVLDWANTVQRLKMELVKRDAATGGRDQSAGRIDASSDAVSR
jgi:hypothetical protein